MCIVYTHTQYTHNVALKGGFSMRVILFDIDTLRPDHLGCYGYGRDTSPAIDSIARDGVRFDNYYCPNAPCLDRSASP